MSWERYMPPNSIDNIFYLPQLKVPTSSSFVEYQLKNASLWSLSVRISKSKGAFVAVRYCRFLDIHCFLHLCLSLFPWNGSTVHCKVEAKQCWIILHNTFIHLVRRWRFAYSLFIGYCLFSVSSTLSPSFSIILSTSMSSSSVTRGVQCWCLF